MVTMTDAAVVEQLAQRVAALEALVQRSGLRVEPRDRPVTTVAGTLEADRVVVRQGNGAYAELDGGGLAVRDRYGRSRVLVGGDEGGGWQVALLDYGLSRDPGADCGIRAELFLNGVGEVTFAVRHSDGEAVVEYIGEDPEGRAEAVRLGRAMLEGAEAKLAELGAEAEDNPPRRPPLRLVRPDERAG